MEKVSILMCVYNSIKRNGDCLLPQTLNAIIAQTHENFELLILDNISTDNTVEICNGFAEKDSRIKLKIDTQQRSPDEGITKLAEDITSDYVMGICDDDMYHPQFIEALMNTLNNNPSINLAYPNGAYITEDDYVYGKLFKLDTTFDGPPQRNYFEAIKHRRAMPILFGIYRKDAYLKNLPFFPFDKLKANVDNLFMIKFFLHNNLASLCNKQLFFYRDRPRELDPSTVIDMPTNPLLIWLYYMRHQMNFYNAISREIDNAPVTDKAWSKLIAIDSCIRQGINLIGWIKEDIMKDKFEKEIADEMQQKCIKVTNLFTADLGVAVTDNMVKLVHKKCAFIYSIVDFVKEHVMSFEIADDLQNIIGQLRCDIDGFSSG